MLKLSPRSMLHSPPQFRIATVAASANQIERLTTSLPAGIPLHHCEDLDQLCEAANYDANLILIFQSYQDQFAPASVALLRNRFPLARLLVVLDVLSAAEGRNRTTWPVAWCVPGWKLHDRLEREMEVLSGNQPALASTASRDEIAGFELSRIDGDSPLPSRHVITYSADPIWNETLQNLLVEPAPGRISIESCKELKDLAPLLNAFPLAALAFDIDPLNSLSEWIALNPARIAERLSIAHSDWVTAETEERLLAAGFRAVVCKLNPNGLQRAILG
ncbi:hypothetical protein [Rubinisphaera margarita]|uniref:hypothetical protein n=1 Tax=Rubinisphaera margarita TaxID=2909586 RepID=UPI001EE943B5|nr:hypothetical protein [Rubinisphaera margarita]MCG6154244.1 hypothetical protein [Rubinisphaera margarita]